MAEDMGINHSTISHWLSGADIPSPRSCQKLSVYSGVPVERILSLAGYLPTVKTNAPTEWPEFKEYAHRKYGDDLDEDLINMIEGLIESRRRRQLSQDSNT